MLLIYIIIIKCMNIIAQRRPALSMNDLRRTNNGLSVGPAFLLAADC